MPPSNSFGKQAKNLKSSAVDQPITEELRHWILEQSQAGFPLMVVLESMMQSGWDEEVALRALESTLQTALDKQGADSATSGITELSATLPASSSTPVASLLSAKPATPASSAEPAVAEPTHHGAAAASASPHAAALLPGPRLENSPAWLDAGDRKVQVLLSMKHPHIVVFGSLLSDEECDALIAAAKPRMARSLTVETQTGGDEVNENRTSDGMFFQRGELDVVQRLEQRIALLLHWPLENGEGLQVLHYRPGAEYKPHYDYFDPAEPGSVPILKRGGQRVGTLVMYLNTPEQGGGTTFPDVHLEVAAQRGNAVFFSYDQPHQATRSLHGGAPVIAGEKWIATKWLREREFR